MNLFFQEKSIWSTLTIIIVAYGHDCGRLIGGGTAADVFRSAMSLRLYRRAL